MRQLPLLLVALSVVYWPPVAGPQCQYPARLPATRQLLQQIDQQLPRSIRQICTGARRYCRASFELDSCFVTRPVASSFPVLSRRLAVRLSRSLPTRYVKPILDTGSIQVLEYGNTADAQAVRAVMDSLVQACQGRSRPHDERCIGTEVYQVARRGNCLMRFNLWAEDPLLRSSANQLKAELLGTWQP